MCARLTSSHTLGLLLSIINEDEQNRLSTVSSCLAKFPLCHILLIPKGPFVLLSSPGPWGRCGERNWLIDKGK